MQVEEGDIYLCSQPLRLSCSCYLPLPLITVRGWSACSLWARVVGLRNLANGLALGFWAIPERGPLPLPP